MQYSRRRIQRVSGVTIRDERIESRDFSVQPFDKEWDRKQEAVRSPLPRQVRSFDRIGAAHRERT
jgi:hypothetical protein